VGIDADVAISASAHIAHIARTAKTVGGRLFCCLNCKACHP